MIRTPVHHLLGGFKNLDPDYRRASIWDRAHSFVVGGTWLVPEKRVHALPAATPDLDLLRHNSGVPTVTWVGHSTVLVQVDGATFRSAARSLTARRPSFCSMASN